MVDPCLLFRMAAIFLALKRRKVVQRSLTRQRIYWEVTNPLEVLREEEVVTRYRLSRDLIFELCGKVDYDLAPVSASQHALLTSLKVLTAFRFYVTGSIYTMGNVSSISRASVCRIVRDRGDRGSRQKFE